MMGTKLNSSHNSKKNLLRNEQEMMLQPRRLPDFFKEESPSFEKNRYGIQHNEFLVFFFDGKGHIKRSYGEYRKCDKIHYLAYFNFVRLCSRKKNSVCFCVFISLPNIYVNMTICNFLHPKLP